MKLKFAARTQAIALLALVATSGALAGVVGDRLLSERSAPLAPASVRDDAGSAPGPATDETGGPPGRFEARPMPRYGQRIARSLDLSASQRAAIDSIVAQEQLRVRELTAEVQPRFRAIADDTRQRIEAVLTPEQRDRLGELRDERVRGMRGMRPEMRGLMQQRRDSMMPRGPDSPESNRPMMERRRELRDSMMRYRGGQD